MNRIDQTFSRLRERNEKAFIAYVSGGDPDLPRSLEIIRALSDAGADLIELGVPFSDPLADGIVNQLAADRALKSGTTVPGILELIRDFRVSHPATPLVLFTYLNPIHAYGFAQFHQDAAAAGADGLLLLDLPPDEEDYNPSFSETCGQASPAGGNQTQALHHIRLIAPNTPDRRREKIAATSSGFIYALSRTGVTGSHSTPSQTIGAEVAQIKRHTSTPVCIGFGIDSPEKAASAAAHSDGVVVGSALVNHIAQNQDSPDLPRLLADFALPLIRATKKASP